ncbi:LamG domain-containing protein [Planctomycetota bacterium]
MNRANIAGYIIIFTLALPSIVMASEDGLIAWWSFEESKENRVKDKAGQIEDVLEGNFKYTSGVKGKALKLDGYTTCIIRKPQQAPKLGDEFTVEAWVALGAYPWNFCPIVSQSKDNKKGYYFAVGPRGEVSLELAVKGQWYTCRSKNFAVPLRKWIHIAGTFGWEKGLNVYVNGQSASHVNIQGKPQFAEDIELRIGANHKKIKPSNIHREHGTLPWWFSIDGIIDEVKIYNYCLTAEEVQIAYADSKTEAEPDLQTRVMPSGPEGPGRFGAYYCNLKYYDEWDNLWAVGSDPDVLVRFDTSGARIVFWRGSRYSPAWVSENGLWMADQSVEAWNDKEGCFEHMQDRLCRYSHVRIIENTDARVVVHWRYAPVSSYDHLWRVDEKTDRAYWVDEYYYIYPDTMAIRKVSWKTGTLEYPRQFQESLPFTQPGQLQSDVINKAFAVVGNLKGQSEVLRFTEEPNENKKFPDDLTIQIYNFKSENKPFIIFEPGNEMHYLADLRLGPRGLDVPGACNHWPVGQMLCDGRTVQAADRPTHFLGFPISDPPVHKKDGRSWWNGFYGMTDKTIQELVVVAKSWVQSPELAIRGQGFSSQGYDISKRVYKLTREETAGELPLEFELLGSSESPVFNPAFVVKNWGSADASLEIDREHLKLGRNFRFGHIHKLQGSNLIVWIRKESTKNVNIKLTPVTVPLSSSPTVKDNYTPTSALRNSPCCIAGFSG